MPSEQNDQNMKIQYSVAALVASSLAANAATVVTSNGILNGSLDDANQAGPVWGQSITANVGADTADATIPATIFITSLAYQYSSSNSGGVPGDFMHVYDSFTTNANGTIATVGNLIAVSDDANIGSPAGNAVLTWTFGGEATDAINKSTEYWYISASTAVAATTGSTGNLVGAGYELATTNPYAGGESVRGNATSSGWDQDFALTTETVAVPEPTSSALLGLAGLALLLRRRK